MNQRTKKPAETKPTVARICPKVFVLYMKDAMEVLPVDDESAETVLFPEGGVEVDD